MHHLAIALLVPLGLASACTADDRLGAAASVDPGGGDDRTLSAQTFIPNLNDCAEVETGVGGPGYDEDYAIYLFGGETLSFSLSEGFLAQPVRIATAGTPTTGDAYVTTGAAAGAGALGGETAGWYGLIVSGTTDRYTLAMTLDGCRH